MYSTADNHQPALPELSIAVAATPADAMGGSKMRAIGLRGRTGAPAMCDACGFAAKRRRSTPGEVTKFVAAALSAVFIACFAPPAYAQVRSTAGNAAAGRAMALMACTGCHVVSPDQPFAPELTGPPDFRTIANMPNTTVASLRRFLSTLRPVPVPGHMADPYLTNVDRENIIAFIMTLQVPR